KPNWFKRARTRIVDSLTPTWRRPAAASPLENGCFRARAMRSSSTQAWSDMPAWRALESCATSASVIASLRSSSMLANHIPAWSSGRISVGWRRWHPVARSARAASPANHTAARAQLRRAASGRRNEPHGRACREQSEGIHSIVRVAARGERRMCPEDYRRVTCSDAIAALDIEHARDFLDVGQNALELFAISDIQGQLDARVEMVGAAVERADIGARFADDAGDFGQHAGTVLGANEQAHGEGILARAGPVDGDASLGLIEQVLHVGAGGAVHRDAAAARDIADDFIPRNRVAALGAVDHQVVVATHEHGPIVDSEHALDGGNKLGRLLFDFFDQRLTAGLAEDLARGILAIAQAGVQVVEFGAAILARHTQQVGLRDFLQGEAALACFPLE